MDYEREARSKDIIAVNTAQFVKSLPVAEPEATAPEEPVVVLGVEELVPLEEGKLWVTVCIPLAVVEELSEMGAAVVATELLTLVEAPGSAPEEVELPPPIVGGAEA